MGTLTVRPRFVSFDCYGTLVKFELQAATRTLLGSLLEHVNADAFFREFDAVRFRTILREYRPYREVLSQSLETAMRCFGLKYRDEYGASLVASVPTFGPYPDVPPALERIRRHCKIAIISNTDDDLIDGTIRNIGVPFDQLVTSEQARAYKMRAYPHTADGLADTRPAYSQSRECGSPSLR